MPEEVDLAPEWLREEILGGSEEVRAWLSSQHSPKDGSGLGKRRKYVKRGRPALGPTTE